MTNKFRRICDVANWLKMTNIFWRICDVPNWLKMTNEFWRICDASDWSKMTNKSPQINDVAAKSHIGRNWRINFNESATSLRRNFDESTRKPRRTIFTSLIRCLPTLLLREFKTVNATIRFFNENVAWQGCRHTNARNSIQKLYYTRLVIFALWWKRLLSLPFRESWSLPLWNIPFNRRRYVDATDLSRWKDVVCQG